MVPITCPTTAPPLLATSDAVLASTLASRAFSAFLRTVLVISSIEEAVSSSELACCSVRSDRSLLPVEISSAARETVSESWRTEDTTEVSDTCMRCRADSTLAVSLGATFSLPVRSPPASRLTALHNWRGSAPSALSKLRVMSQPASDASTMDSRLAPMRIFLLRMYCSLSSCRMTAERCSVRTKYSSLAATRAASSGRHSSFILTMACSFFFCKARSTMANATGE